MTSKTRILFFLTALFPAALFAVDPASTQPSPTAKSEPFPVTINVDVADNKGRLTPIWRFFGADEPNYATMKDGKQLIGELGELTGRTGYFRTHNLLCTGDGTAALKWGSTNAYTEDAQGNPIYDWKILDGIFDTYHAAGIKPYAQIGFMPEALSINPQPYQHHWKPGLKYEEIITGWAYPPKDYAKWSELVYQWTKHCVQRYGKEEVLQWWWEVWNEPNGAYWKGTHEEFFKLHDFAVDAVRRALPGARVGGMDTAGPGGKFTRDFIEHCLRGTNYATGKTGTPLDFVAFHAKGSPKFVDGHVQMGISNQLRAINDGFGIVASYPELKNTPIVIGESDPDGCAACQGEQLGYRNGTMYSSYTAASFARKFDLAEKHHVNLDGALTWAFEFENQPWFAGFRVLATNGVDLPVLNVFRMFGKMGGDRIGAQSSAAVSLDTILKNGVREAPDVAALASRDPKTGRIAIMVWHYHDDDVPGPAADVKLTLSHLPNTGVPRITHYRIDETHSNAFTEWKKMGSPMAPDASQYAQLQKAGQLATLDTVETAQFQNKNPAFKFKLPRQAVSLLVLDWDAK